MCAVVPPVATTGVGAVGAGGAGTAGAGATMGVKTMPVTAPLIASLAFAPLVPRAARVAARFAVAAALCSTVRGVAAFFGASPNRR